MEERKEGREERGYCGLHLIPEASFGEALMTVIKW
jgi:hypothetical protein